MRRVSVLSTRKPSGKKLPENACGETRFPCVETRAGYRARVYCTGLLRTGLLSYVSRKEVAETSLVRVRVRSTVHARIGHVRWLY